jgi:two-component system chemotaxis response regulator CheY
MKIFVVDDSKTMRMIVKRTLRQAGFGDAEVAEAVNGKEALEKMDEVAPDLILCDWNMPEMNGLEFLQALKAKGDTTKFGFVTSEGTPEMIQKATDNGAAFLIAKPFNADTFKEKLEPVLK